MAEKITGTSLTISKILLGDSVEINGHLYKYIGQEKVKQNLGKINMYCFEGLGKAIGFRKEFNVNASLKFIKTKEGKIYLIS